MASNVNKTSLDFYHKNWEQLLLKGDLHGRKIEKLATQMADQDASSLLYDSVKKTISSDNSSLNLEAIARKKRPAPFSRLKHRYQLMKSDSYRTKHSAKIRHLAELITKKLQEDKALHPESYKESPLKVAIERGDQKEIQKLLKKGADLNYVDAEGDTPLITAIRSKRHSIAHLLIEKGADLKLANTLGTTPLMFAASNGNSLDIIDCLVKNGADPNVRDSFGNTALMYAPLTGGVYSISTVKALIQAKVNLNIADNNGITPLHRAIQLGGELELVKIFIESGADVNLSNKTGYTPLMQAAFMGNLGVFNALLNNGADVSRQWDGLTVFSLIKRDKPLNNRKMINGLIKKNPELKTYYKEEQSRKGLAHAWHLGGLSLNEKAQNYFSLEGARSELWYKEMLKNLDPFSASYPGTFSNPQLFQEAVAWASVQSARNNKSFLKRIQGGLPTFINTGFKGHAVTLLIWGDQLIICNRGAESNTPLEVYHFDPTLLTEKHIENIRKFDSWTSQEYRELFSYLPAELKFSQSPEDLRIQEEGRNLYNQVVGNCSWVSPITGVYAYLMLSGLRGEKDGKLQDPLIDHLEMSQEIEKQRTAYKTWLGFQQIASLEKMIKLVGKSDIEADHALIQRVFYMAYFPAWDSIQSKKLDALAAAYADTLSPEAVLNFQKKVQFWKMSASAFSLSQRQIVL